MRTLLFLFAAFHTGMAFAQTGAAGAGSLVEAGIPALSREWLGDDYLQASKVLALGSVQLPMLTDEQGRLFLERLTSTGNFSFHRKRTLPIDNRLPDFLNLMEGANAILKLYLVAANKQLDVHREMALQLAFALRIAAMEVELIEEFLPSIPKDDKYEVRMAGMKRAYGGMTTVFAGAMVSLNEKNFYSTEDLTLLLTTMAETLPVVKKAFPADYKTELRKKLEAQRATFPEAEGVKAIGQMIDELGA